MQAEENRKKAAQRKVTKAAAKAAEASLNRTATAALNPDAGALPLLSPRGAAAAVVSPHPAAGATGAPSAAHSPAGVCLPGVFPGSPTMKPAVLCFRIVRVVGQVTTQSRHRYFRTGCARGAAAILF